MGIKIMQVFALLSLVVFLSVLANKVWTLGDSEDDYGIVCLGGHEYWRANFAAKGFLGIRLDDNGKPVSCE